MGCVVNDNLPFNELPIGPRQAAVILIAALLATGFIERESVSVMQAEEVSRMEFCPRYDANGRQLQASMVMASYQKGAVQQHECLYAYRSER